MVLGEKTGELGERVKLGFGLVVGGAGVEGGVEDSDGGGVGGIQLGGVCWGDVGKWLS